MAIALSGSHDAIEQAIAAGPLAELQPATLERLRAGAMRIDLPAGTVVERGCEARFLALVVDGVLRFYLASADGRQATFRYARAGGLVGVPTLFGVPRVLPSSMQATTDTTLLAFDPDLATALAAAEPGLAIVLAGQLTDALWETMETVGEMAFGSIRQRLARHLLDLAEPRPGRPPVVRRSHQEVADAIGSVREVVTRVIGQLRDEGIVTTGPGGVVLEDAGALVRLTWAGPLAA